MARLVIGTNKTATTPAVVRDVAPERYLSYSVSNGDLVHDTSVTSMIDLSGVTTLTIGYILNAAFKNCTNITGTLDFSNITSISGVYACYQMCMGCTGVTGVQIGFTTITGDYACNEMFSGCTGITGALDLSSITSISGNRCCIKMFNNCKITSVDLSKLTTVTGGYACNSMFMGCTNLTTVDISLLTTVPAGAFGVQQHLQSMFAYTALTTITFQSLATLAANAACSQMFWNTTTLTSVYFPSLKSFGNNTNQFYNMLQGCTGVTVHFPSNVQSVIGSWSDVTNGFGGTNTTVLFDLPATNTLTGADSVTYTRNPKYDTATALAWKVGAYGTTNFTPAYYTSGTTDPAVSDTIYSDSACTTAVTTISSIA